MKWFLVVTSLIMGIESYSQNPKYSDTVKLNGLNTYYEVYGTGRPLFLLHGFTQSSKSWVSFVNEYSDEFEIYLVDLMGHGKSSGTWMLSTSPSSSTIYPIKIETCLSRLQRIS